MINQPAIETSGHSMAAAMDRKGTRRDYWIPRLNSILANYFDQMNSPRVPHPEFFEIVLLAIGRFTEITYQINALGSCVQLSQLDNLISNARDNRDQWETSRGEIQSVYQSFLQIWNKEYAESASSEPAPTASSSNGKNESSPDYSTGRDQESTGVLSAEDYTSRSVSAGSENKTAGSVPPSGTFSESASAAESPGALNLNGTFSYLEDQNNEFELDLLEIFLSELNDQINAAENLFITLETSGENLEPVKELFRILHTIKGNSGLLALQEFMNLTHSMEQYLEPVRSQKVPVDGISTDLLLTGVDLLKSMEKNLFNRLKKISGQEADPEFFPVDWQPVMEKFNALL